MVDAAFIWFWELFTSCVCYSLILTHTHQLLISRLIAFISSRPVIYWLGKIKVIMDRELAILETAPMLIQTSFKGIHGWGFSVFCKARMLACLQ